MSGLDSESLKVMLQMSIGFSDCEGLQQIISTTINFHLIG